MSRVPTGLVAVVHIRSDGSVDYHATPGVVMLVVDDGVPGDRVYEIQSTLDDAGIREIVGADEVRTLHDMPAAVPATRH